MHLIIQGPNVETTDLKQLAKLSGANGIEQTSSNVFRLANASPHADIEPLCAQAQLDFAFVPETQALSQIGLVGSGVRPNRTSVTTSGSCSCTLVFTALPALNVVINPRAEYTIFPSHRFCAPARSLSRTSS